MRKQLKQWIKKQHRDQIIRRTNELYFNHLVFVAEEAGVFNRLSYEIGLCHDLLEKTRVTADQLYEALLGFGYREESAAHITGCVVELTDVYTKETYPYLKKKERKKLEMNRLATISADAQTVKYADLIYNIQWMRAYDVEGLSKYLRRKQNLLSTMEKGDDRLRAEASLLIATSLKSLSTTAS